MFRMRPLLLGAAIFTGAISFSSSSALAVPCVAAAGFFNEVCAPAPGSGVLTTTISWNGSGSVSYSNSGANSAPASFAGYSLLDTTPPTGPGPFMTINVGANDIGDANHGTWNVTGSGFSNLLLVFQYTINGDTNPDWIAFTLANVLSGAWAESGSDEDLTKVFLYGNNPLSAPAPSPNPLPGAVVLMGSVLAGGFGAGAWRRRRTQKAA